MHPYRDARQLSGGSYLFAALLLLILPLKWMIAAVFAAGLHELFHYLCIRLCGGSICRLSLGLNGAVLEFDGLSREKELICTLAGPLSGLLLLLAIRWIPRTAICGACYSLYNLLPIYPMDGGRALRCIVEMVTSEHRAKKICLFIGNGVRILIFLLGLYVTLAGFGWIGLFASLILLLKTKNRNYSCKQPLQRVQ